MSHKKQCPNCSNQCYRDSSQCLDCSKKRRSALPSVEQPPKQHLVEDLRWKRTTEELNHLKRKYAESIKTIANQEQEIRVLGAIGEGIETYQIEPCKGSGTSEGTAILVASDWHVEETVKPGIVSGLNEFTLDIAKERSIKFFTAGLRLIQLLQQDIRIDNVVLALLGDFISNDIHEEFPETNSLTPMQAIQYAQGLIISGIEFLLENSKANLIIPCHSGNHARTTKTTRFGTENGHSLEFLMYCNLSDHFRDNKRVTFIIPEGPHSYLDIYGQMIRFHHGHMIKYQGGIGGIFIPAFKAIAQWNKARHADLDIFGHFHQCKDGGNFICNGSLIGYNSFALSIKADYEPPKQQLLLIDKKRGRTCNWPILVA